MIRLTKYSLILLITISSISFSQKLSSFEVNGNVNFDDEQYLKWSEVRLNQNIFPGILDSVKARIVRNVLLSGYHFYKYLNSDLIISADSITFKIILDVDENNPVIIKKIIFSGLDSTANQSLINQFNFLNNNKKRIQIEKFISKNILL